MSKPITTPEGIEQGVGMLRTALERGYDFVLVIEGKTEGTGSKMAVTQTNLTDNLKTARMLERFAKARRKDAKGWK